MKITLISSVFLVAFLLLFSCNKEEPIENIAGEYSASFYFDFSGAGITGNSEGNISSLTITQTEGSIVVKGVPGSIDSNNNVTFSGDFLGDGVQNFTGSYNPSNGTISGSLNGTYEIDVWSGYSMQSVTVTISNGTCTLTPLD